MPVNIVPKASNDRSEVTRQRLIEAGMDLFARVGYEATTTRALADAAGTNLAAIPYHFGGKDGLYLAVAAAVNDVLHAEMDPFLNDVQKEIDGGVGSPHQAMALIERLIGDYAHVMLQRLEAEKPIRFMLREKMEPNVSFSIIQQGPDARLREMLEQLLTFVMGRTADDIRVRLFAIQLMSMAVVFRAARASALTEYGWEVINVDAYNEIRAVVMDGVRILLKGLQANR